MKRLMSFVVLAVLVGMVGAYAAADSLEPLYVNMQKTDVTTTTYCVENIRPANAIMQIVVDPICRDVNSITGCQAGDQMNPSEFSVTPLVQDLQLVNGAGCVQLTLTTTDAEGTFYYTVNGEIGQAKITSETGSVDIPEFGIIGAALILAVAGMFIARRRQ